MIKVHNPACLPRMAQYAAEKPVIDIYSETEYQNGLAE